MGITLEEYTERLKQVAALELVLKNSWAHGGELMGQINGLKRENARLRELLSDARDHAQHPEYEWNMEFRKEVDRALNA